MTKYSRVDQVKLFKRCLPQILRGPFLNIWTHMLDKCQLRIKNNIRVSPRLDGMHNNGIAKDKDGGGRIFKFPHKITLRVSNLLLGWI